MEQIPQEVTLCWPQYSFLMFKYLEHYYTYYYTYNYYTYHYYYYYYTCIIPTLSIEKDMKKAGVST